MSKISKIEDEILAKMKLVTEKMDSPSFYSSFTSIVHPNRKSEVDIMIHELEQLKTKKQFLLDRRESWLPKALWNLVAPVVVSIITALIVTILSK